MSFLPVPLTVLLGELPVLVRPELTRLSQAQPDYQQVGLASSADGRVTAAQITDSFFYSPVAAISK